jgi:hypothetical protein
MNRDSYGSDPLSAIRMRMNKTLLEALLQYTFYLSITLLKVTRKSAISSHPSKVSTTVIY